MNLSFAFPIVAQKLTTLDNVLLPTCYYCCTKQNNTDNVQNPIFFPQEKKKATLGQCTQYSILHPKIKKSATLDNVYNIHCCNPKTTTTKIKTTLGQCTQYSLLQTKKKTKKKQHLENVQ